MTRHTLQLVLLWLVLSAMLALGLNELTWRQVSHAVHEKVRHHLLLSLDESLFGSADNRVNDQDAIRYAGGQINIALQDFIQSRWYAPLHACQVQLQSLDHVLVDNNPADRLLLITLPRNQIDREIMARLGCENNWRLAILGAGVLGLIFALIHHLFPPP